MMDWHGLAWTGMDWHGEVMESDHPELIGQPSDLRPIWGKNKERQQEDMGEHPSVSGIDWNTLPDSGLDDVIEHLKSLDNKLDRVLRALNDMEKRERDTQRAAEKAVREARRAARRGS